MSFPPAPDGSVESIELADWAEASALVSGPPFKRGDLKSAVDGLSSGGDALVENAWRQLEDRARLLGASWPFRIEGNLLEYRGTLQGDQKAIYAYCAFLSYASFTKTDTVLFEQIVQAVVSDRFEGAALRIGHPARGGMNKSFRVRSRLYARASRLAAGEVGVPPLSSDKDLGLDIVAWHRSPDLRGAELHFLIQCATGRDWTQKTHDIDFSELTPHLNWGATPVRVMCVPHSVVVDEPRWLRWNRAAGMIYDRSRLVDQVRPETLDAKVRDELASRIELFVQE